MRPRFEKHAKEIAKARSLFSWDSDPETVLASGDPRVVEAWSGLEEHLTAAAKIVLVAREFGCKLSAQFPQIVPYTAGNSVAISDEALMCASGNGGILVFRAKRSRASIKSAVQGVIDPAHGRKRPRKVSALGRRPVGQPAWRSTRRPGRRG